MKKTIDWNDIGKYVKEILKTDVLCKQLAKAGVPLTQDDLDFARYETNTLPFSEGDIHYLRKLMTNPEYAGLDRALNMHIDTMKQLPANERLAYWDRWAKPISERKNQIAFEVKMESDNLYFYAPFHDYKAEYEERYGKG